MLLTTVTKSSILGVAAVADLPLEWEHLVLCTDCGKISVVWSATFCAARKNLSCLDKAEWLCLKQKTNLSSKTVKWGLCLCFTHASKSEYRTCKSFKLFH